MTRPFDLAPQRRHAACAVQHPYELSLWALFIAALLASCASAPPSSPAGRPRPATTPGADGPPALVPAGLLQVPDATPRMEALRPGGPNKPYEVFGVRYVPLASDTTLTDEGGASWYGTKFHGKPTSSGEVYDMFAMTAAHKTMPIPSYARVRNPANGREIVVRINDRGPFVAGRVIDLSYTAALKLDLLRGVAPVVVQHITHEEIRSAQGLRVQPPEHAEAQRVRALLEALAP